MYLRANGATSRLGRVQFAKFHSKFTGDDVNLVFVLLFH